MSISTIYRTNLGLESHPQHEVFKKNARGMSGMVTFTTKGNIENCKKVLENLKCFTLAESLGKQSNPILAKQYSRWL